MPDSTKSAALPLQSTVWIVSFSWSQRFQFTEAGSRGRSP